MDCTIVKAIIFRTVSMGIAAYRSMAGACGAAVLLAVAQGGSCTDGCGTEACVPRYTARFLFGRYSAGGRFMDQT